MLDQLNTIITLLTIVVVILSVVIVALIVTITVVLVKMNKLINDAQAVTHNVAQATKWLNPATVFGELVKAFRNR